MNIDHLNKQHALPNLVRFEPGEGGLTRVVITAPAAEAHLYLHGAHLTHYRRRGGPSVLFLSEKSMFLPDKPIRGGVPICFPWFGPRPDPQVGRPESPMHGFARLMDWSVESITKNRDESVTATLALRATPQTLDTWPHPFELRYAVTIGPTLKMALGVRNQGNAPFTFQEALHTYFVVSDVRKISVHGLEGVPYLSKVEGGPQPASDKPITVAGETDRVYFNTKAACTLDDPGFNRRLTVSKGNSNTTVVWNPWVAKAKAMPDFGDEEWPGMICIETCNALENAVTLEAGKSHTMSAEIA